MFIRFCQVRFLPHFSTAIVLFCLFHSLDLLLTDSSVLFVLFCKNLVNSLNSASGSSLHLVTHNPHPPVVTVGFRQHGPSRSTGSPEFICGLCRLLGMGSRLLGETGSLWRRPGLFPKQARPGDAGIGRDLGGGDKSPPCSDDLVVLCAFGSVFYSYGVTSNLPLGLSHVLINLPTHTL